MVRTEKTSRIRLVRRIGFHLSLEEIMLDRSRKVVGIASIAAVLAASLVTAPAMAAGAASAMEEGKKLAFTRKKGNCLACHLIEGGKAAGNIGPPLLAMKARYPNKKDLHDQIWDATAKNPESPMPAFGKYEALSAAEIDKIVDFIWSL
ncbi:sulfur oxidation c-type cytochrome SoxX [endosymbiont of Ridgeia piscesae]|nr:sulfur oxidation c-type cytochrome SoxX [endosymbiont of Ridgeia piscesae]